MNTLEFIKADTDTEIQDIAILANEIWHEYFTPIIGEAQVEYMVDKFQSYHALKEQVSNGYEYYQIHSGHTFVGYIGAHEENGSLFLSKLYVKKDFRGQHISSAGFHYLVDLCKERGLSKIWLTCNRNNTHSLEVYHHWGFVTTKEEKADIGNGFYMDDYILEYAIG